MKKTMMAILLFDMVAGLLFLGLYGLRDKAVAADSGFVRVVGGETEWEPEDVKKIAFFFDAATPETYTAQLLDGLKERGIHATFFVTGEHAELHPEIIQRMAQEGHLIGNHTYKIRTFISLIHSRVPHSMS